MKELKLLLPASTRNKTLFKGVKMSMNLEAKEPNTLWGIDMTHIWCGNDGWGYLHAVIDHYDKTLLGYHFSTSCKAIGAVLAISEAANRREVTELELRSDNGCHYGARVFRDELKRLGINHTRTMVNTPKGNAVIERFFRSLKQEWLAQTSPSGPDCEHATRKFTHKTGGDHQILGTPVPIASADLLKTRKKTINFVFVTVTPNLISHLG